MENLDQNKQEEMWRQFEENHKRGKVIGGLLVVIAGSLFLAKELGASIPHWVFTWKMFLIALGLLIAVKHNFRGFAWLALMLIGGAFLLGDIMPALAIKPLIWPVVIILFGLFLMFKPRRHRHWHRWQKMHGDKTYYYKSFSCVREGESVHEDTIDSTSFMGGVKKNILSKNFKGGEVTNVFGGAEINLSQADFDGTATLELTNIFGGTKLIIPSNWEISSELTSVLGSIEDKRPVQPKVTGTASKILVLKGTTFFGGIDIKSY